ncbi:hypothetical protein CTI12_AA168450 [Artemisia annua]|uniref:Uncharacterized protein n=1 Tax=Artemisia annua TaxID=35608 RepID=A0A2U1PCC4_ARTAN|nr:hypothetical protein CTI12_AA168450 [Artemisia annua]
MIRKCDVDFPCLHLIYDFWDTMIEEVREKIFKHEGLDAITGDSPFFNVSQTVLEARWNKSNTPLHSMAHSLVPKYYSETWLEVGSSLVPRVTPNEDQDVSYNRDKCFKKMFTNPYELRKVYAEYGQFSGTLGFFGEAHVMDARAREDPLSWWQAMARQHQHYKLLRSDCFPNPLLPHAAKGIGALSQIFKVLRETD